MIPIVMASSVVVLMMMIVMMMVVVMLLMLLLLFQLVGVMHMVSGNLGLMDLIGIKDGGHRLVLLMLLLVQMLDVLLLMLVMMVELLLLLMVMMMLKHMLRIGIRIKAILYGMASTASAAVAS